LADGALALAWTVVGRVHNFLSHFDDLEIIGLYGESNVPGLWRLIGAAARKGDPKKLSDTLRGQLAAALMAAILDRLPYPTTLLARTVARCRAEQSAWPVRAGLIKASLNRRSPEKGITVKPYHEPNVGYRLGRLFAVLRTSSTALRAISMRSAIVASALDDGSAQRTFSKTDGRRTRT
jgi:CRISPR-associated protein Csd1